jgi:hypothetical protein
MDWRTYERFYNTLINSEGKALLYLLFLRMEPGYALYNYIFAKMGVPFWYFFIFTKVVVFFIIMKSLEYFSPRRTFFLSLQFLTAIFLYAVFINDPMRNLIAVAIFLCAMKSLIEGKFIPYFIWTILAISFHFSAIILILLYVLRKTYFNTSILVLFYIFINILFSNRTILFTVARNIFFFIPFIARKIESYAEVYDGKIVSFGLLLHTMFFILFLIFRKRIESIRHGKLIFTFSVIYIFIFRLALTITVAGRFRYYVCPFFAISIGIIINAFSKDMKWIYAMSICILSIILCFNNITTDSRFIPYTNYLFYINNEMSFNERDYYNDNNSPYPSAHQVN